MSITSLAIRQWIYHADIRMLYTFFLNWISKRKYYHYSNRKSLLEDKKGNKIKQLWLRFWSHAVLCTNSSSEPQEQFDFEQTESMSVSSSVKGERRWEQLLSLVVWKSADCLAEDTHHPQWSFCVSALFPRGAKGVLRKWLTNPSIFFPFFWFKDVLLAFYRRQVFLKRWFVFYF